MFNSSSTDSHFYNNDIDEFFNFFLSSSGNNKSEIFHLQIKIEINILRKINFWGEIEKLKLSFVC